VCIALRVEFLLKTDSGYPRDAEVTLFTLCFINPRVRKIRNEASSCPGIFSRTLRFGEGKEQKCIYFLFFPWGVLSVFFVSDHFVCLRVEFLLKTDSGYLFVCVLLCFIKPILGNRYGPGVIP